MRVMNPPARVTKIAAADWAYWRSQMPGVHDKAAFCTAGWIDAWAAALLPYRDWSGPLTGFAVRDGGRVLGVLPLATQSIGPLRVRSLAGPFSPYRTLPVTADEVGRAVFAAAIAEHFGRNPPSVALRVGPMLASDPGVQALVDALLRGGWHGLCNVSGPALVLDLPSTEAELLRAASPSLLKNNAYLRRKLTKDAGAVVFTRHVIGPESADLLREVATVEARSWVASEGGDTKFIDHRHQDFWSRLGQAPAQGSEAVAWLLRAGGAPIAFSAHVETSRSLHVIANGYDASWKAYSPGSLLSQEVLADACRRGRSWLNWGQGDSGYKQRWGARDSDRLLDLLLFRPGVLGSALRRLARWRLPAWRPVAPGESLWGVSS